MFFAKIKISEDATIKVDAETLDFSAVCPTCGKEFPIDTSEYLDVSEKCGEIHCEDCTEQMKPFIIQRPERDYDEYDWFSMLTRSEYPSDLFIWTLRHAPREFLDAASDWMMKQVPGYHNDLPLGDINDELERRQKEAEKHAKG